MKGHRIFANHQPHTG